MSLKAMSAPRASVFTFESTVHSSHVLRCLDDQRRRDVLCDVTVVVEGQSFRAHRSVLASCSEYFTHRISSLTQHGAVITLPQEVTAAGFEPLLKFAYTSKLLFGKDNVLEMRNSASVLGFRDLDEACFDFLLPKFFSSTKGSVPCPRKTCCKKKYKRQLSKTDSCTDSDVVVLDEKEVKPVDDSSSQQEVVWPCRKSESSKLGSQNSAATLDTAAEGANNGFMQCPKYRKFQLACGKDACVVAKNLAAAIRDECGLSCSPCSSGTNSKNETEQTNPAKLRDNGAEERRKTEIHDKKIDVDIGEDEKDTTEREGTLDDIMKMEEEMEHFAGVSSPDRSSVEAVSSGESTRLGERSPGLILHHCLPRASAGGPVMSRSQGQQRLVMDLKDDKKTKESCEEEPVSIFQRAEEQAEAEGERGIMDRATLPVNTAREGSTMGSDEGSSDPDAGRSSNTGSGQLQATSVNWLKLHANLSSRGSECPFLQDLDQSKCLWKGAGVSECTSHSGVSSLNSGEDSETETEGDSEAYTRERARQVQLPFSVDWIVDLSRNDFQQLLKQQSFTQEQLEFVHDMRRRSKNRQAAQRCRKRKLDCIYNLQCEINKLKTEREKLIVEKSQLSQLKVTTGHSVSALCQRVCSEANLQPEQLQVLAKYMSPDCPLTSLFPHIDTLLSKSRLPLP